MVMAIDIKKTLISFTFVVLLTLLFFVNVVTNRQGNETVGAEEPDLGASMDDGSWITVSRFDGYQTKADANKVTDGANPQGQNTIINDGDRITIRNFGYEIFGTATTTASPIKSLHTFRKRSGENIMIRTYDTNIEYFEEDNDTWEVVSSTYTSGKSFGFADFNINTDAISYTYFGNGFDNFSRWTGAHTITNGAVALNDSEIVVDDTTDGFSSSGILVVCGTELAYGSKTASQFNLSASSTVACADDKGVTQAITSFPTYPKGNTYLVANNRLFVSGVSSTPQAVFFSKYGDADVWLTTLVADGTADAAGVFNLTEGGGPVRAMVQDEGSIYFFKRSMVYKATLTDALYTLLPLKPFDAKSQTTGAMIQGSTFTGGNGVYFITPDRQIMNLTRVEDVDYPQIVAISDIVKPTVNEGVFDEASGIFWQGRAYISFKSNDKATFNNTVFAHNFRRSVETGRSTWESPIVGWNASTWTIYDDGTSEELYYGSSVDANIFKVTDETVDNELGITANWRSKQFDFGLPHSLKEIDNVYVEGFISPNTTLSIKLFLDENGFTQTYSTDFVGTETTYLFDAEPENVFGFHPFGFQRFGSSDQPEKDKFRIYLNKDFRRIPFYTAQIEFASDDIGQDWEITTFGFHVAPDSQPERRSLYREFN